MFGAARRSRPVTEVYGRRAAHYDLTSKLYYGIGFREIAYRHRAVRALQLAPGDTVVEIGCGTGQNLAQLQTEVGPMGHIIGVDLTDAMLDQARLRVARNGWENVELVNCDAADFDFPSGNNGIFSTLALSLSPRCGEVIRKGAASLAPGGRWSVMDMKVPGGRLAGLVPLMMPILRPFAVDEDAIQRRPWEEIQHAMRTSLDGVSVNEGFLGMIFQATGWRD
ncbi:MAG: methyltransferase domain-containing protein [Oligoflexia bacterium]|nr:methyltransferase domain-containing protein [Oligoflexia bacterium]